MQEKRHLFDDKKNVKRVLKALVLACNTATAAAAADGSAVCFFSWGLTCLAAWVKNEFDADAVGRNSPSGPKQPLIKNIIRDVYGPKQPLQLAQRRLSSTNRLHGSCRCHHNPPHSISCTRCFRSSSSAGVCRRRRTSGSSRRAEAAALRGAVPPADVFSHATPRPSVRRLCRLCLSPSQPQTSRRPPPSSQRAPPSWPAIVRW